MRRSALKGRLIAWCEAEIRLQAAEKIAKEIRRSVPVPVCRMACPGCPECIRWEQAQHDADLAVELGGLGGAR